MPSSSSGSPLPPAPPNQPPPCCPPPPVSSCPCPCPAETDHPIRYWNGAVVLVETDLSIPEGDLFSHKRLYGNQASGDYDGPCGWNWWVPGLPYLYTTGGTSAPLAVVIDPNNPYWFDQTSPHTYAAKYHYDYVTTAKEDQAHQYLNWLVRQRAAAYREGNT